MLQTGVFSHDLSRKMNYVFMFSKHRPAMDSSHFTFCWGFTKNIMRCETHTISRLYTFHKMLQNEQWKCEKCIKYVWHASDLFPISYFTLFRSRFLIGWCLNISIDIISWNGKKCVEECFTLQLGIPPSPSGKYLETLHEIGNVINEQLAKCFSSCHWKQWGTLKKKKKKTTGQRENVNLEK